MSLFKSREWWSVNLNENEMYDSQCLLIFNLEKDLHHSILLGSHEGFLRLFSPLSELVDGVIVGYKPSHLLLEVQLPSPILQINEGILVSQLNAQMVEMNKKLANEKRERDEYMKKHVYTNIPTDDYYNQFNTSLY